ncbi:MAG: hypothetical protein IJ634_07020, partial [Bacteroidales bacterium]|nr:hypothetical protein [Bacteroidales bacterium]
SFSTSLFSVESECKDTTIFQTDKIFFQKNFHPRTKHLKINHHKNKKKFNQHPRTPRKTPLPNPFSSKNPTSQERKTAKSGQNQNIAL